MKSIFGDVVLRIHDVLNTLVALMGCFDWEEDIVLGPCYFPKGRNQRRFVGVADIIFAPFRFEVTICLRNQEHFTGVEVGTMFLLGKAKRKNSTVFQELGGAFLEG